MELRLLKIFAYIFILLVAIETGLEIRAHSRGYETILFGKVSSTDRPVKESAVQTGNFGPTETFPFRSPVISPETSEYKTKIWISSSSYSEDIYLPVEKIYPYLLYEFLNKDSEEFVVINAARAGEGIYQNCEKLKQLAPRWKPDYVLLYQMSLEVIQISREVFSQVKSQGPIHARQQTQSEQKASWAKRLLEETTLYAHLKEYGTSPLKRSRVLHDQMETAGVNEFKSILNYFIETCRQINAEPILCTFATSHVRADMENLPLAIKNWMFLYNDQLSEEGFIDAIERFNRVIIRTAREENCLVIDVASAVSGQPEYFRDFVHFSETGHVKIAEVMYRILKNLES